MEENNRKRGVMRKIIIPISITAPFIFVPKGLLEKKKRKGRDTRRHIAVIFRKEKTIFLPSMPPIRARRNQRRRNILK